MLTPSAAMQRRPKWGSLRGRLKKATARATKQSKALATGWLFKQGGHVSVNEDGAPDDSRAGPT